MSEPVHLPNPDGSGAPFVRQAFPDVTPQLPFNEPPPTPEQSQPTWGIVSDKDHRIPMRDGIRLAADVYRPEASSAERFPALIGFGPYTRQLQDTDVPIGQNEAGIKEFWVPRGYVMVMIDVRGTNDSEGEWDFYGPTEHEDLAEAIEWVAAQPWCDGNVGMFGASYYGRTQLFAAGKRPPSLKAIFPLDAATDAYRDALYHGGIPNERMQWFWVNAVREMNVGTGRLKEEKALLDIMRRIRLQEFKLDGEFWRERSARTTLDQIEIPTYFACRWTFYDMHLKGVFDGWLETGDIPKRIAVGPNPSPRRPVAEYHLEALRWYDHWLKGMDTGIMNDAPIHLWVQGADHWRDEHEWPLARTEWRTLHLGGSSDGDATLTWDAVPEEARTYRHDPASPEWLTGGPKLAWRTGAATEPWEITGPIQADIWLTSDAEDTDILVSLHDEAPDGTSRVLTRGWLRASHRAVDPALARQNRPWHPHDREEPLTPGEPTLLQIEVVPTCNVFQPGHRLRFEVSSADDMIDNIWYHRTLNIVAENTIHQGGSHASVLHAPFIPQD